MTSKYICSDLHLGHKNIEYFRPIGLSSVEQHEHILEQLNLLSKRDICYILGDCVFDEYWLNRMKEIRCRLILVGGNHDLEITTIINSGVFEKVYGLTRHKAYWLSHAPIHPMELRGKKNCHGHLHYHLVVDREGQPDPNYKSACLEYTDYKPIPWDYFISEEYFQECVKKWNVYKLDSRLITEHSAG